MIINRLLSFSILLLSVFSAGLGFAQEDHVSIKRIVGDFYDITISGERNGESATVNMVTTESHKFFYNPPLGNHPVLAIYAVVESEGNSTTKTKYSFTFREELSGMLYGINYYVTDNYGSMNDAELVDWMTLDNMDRALYDSHYDDGYYFYPDLTASSFDLQPESAFTIHNIKVEGVKEPIWATFKWNPRNLKFELQETGFEK